MNDLVTKKSNTYFIFLIIIILLSINSIGQNSVSIGDVNLTIYDSFDTSTAQINETVWFYANYTNNSEEINGATCNIKFNDNTSEIMTDTGYQSYYSKNFSNENIYIYNITCNKTGYTTLNVIDNVSIQLLLVSFISPTPNNNAIINNNHFYINLSTTSIRDYYSFVELNQDLILWLRFDNVNTTGYPIDLSSYNNKFTLRDNASLTPTGKFGTGCHLDGKNDDILLLNSTNFRIVENFTQALWFKRDDNSTGEQVFYASISTAGFYTQLTGSKLQFRDVSGGLSTGSLTDDYVINDTNWHHAAFVSNPNQLIIYLDGAIAANKSGTIINTSTTFQIGSTNSRWFNGSMDEIMIFKRELSADEIAALYNSTLSKYNHDFTKLGKITLTFENRLSPS